MQRSSRVVLSVLLSLPCVFVVERGLAQQTASRTGAVAGLITDATGARIPGARVHLEGRAGVRDVTADALGHFSVRVPAGSYRVTVGALGFLTLQREGLKVSPEANPDLAFTLAVNVEATEVNVNGADLDSTDAANNHTATVLRGAELATMSDDDTTFQQQIQAMAGGGESGDTQLLVDGFSGGRFPPKNSIREVRINNNPFSALYDSLGFGRIEVFTKPGADKFHGNFNAGGNNQSFNAPNPFNKNQPPYHNLYFDGELNGPLGNKASFFLSGERIDQQNNAVVNAATDTGLISEAVPNPQITDTFSVRLDRQLTPNNVITGRYEWNNSGQANSGVGLLVLPSQGVTTSTTAQTLQVSDTETVGAATVFETRLEYVRTRLNQTPNSNSPTITVQGTFSGGGSPSQAIRDNQDHYELQEYVSHVWGKHLLRAGGRLRSNRDANTSTGGFNGSFTFASLGAYQAALAGNSQGVSQFTLTTGLSSFAISSTDAGLYAEDEWKFSNGLTLNSGFRFETQTAIPDHVDPAPRLGLAYALAPGKRKEPLVVLRGGYGVFYDRFALGDLLTSVRQNGVSQRTYYAENPGFFCTAADCLSSHLASLPSTQPTVYQVDPNLRSGYGLIASFSGEHSFGDKGSVGMTYINIRREHQFFSRNINAPLPGTYDPTVTNSGVRPLGGTQNIYQYSSGGVRRGQVLLLNVDLNPTKRLSVWGFYNLQFRHGDVSGADSFPSNQYNLAQDYGRSATARSRLFAGLWYNAPKGFNGGLFLRTYSGTPFNITNGTDNNGDTIFNDRPAFATDMRRPSVVRTMYGNFDTAPMAGQTIIPINYATSPAYASLQTQLSWETRFGPRPAAVMVPGQPLPAGRPEPRYNLRFSLEVQNVTNHTNRGVPVGVLSSPYFGQSISLADNFSGITAANRALTARTSFSF